MTKWRHLDRRFPRLLDNSSFEATSVISGSPSHLSAKGTRIGESSERHETDEERSSRSRLTIGGRDRLLEVVGKPIVRADIVAVHSYTCPGSLEVALWVAQVHRAVVVCSEILCR